MRMPRERQRVATCPVTWYIEIEIWTDEIHHSICQLILLFLRSISLAADDNVSSLD